MSEQHVPEKGLRNRNLHLNSRVSLGGTCFEPPWRQYLDAALTLHLSSTVIKTRFLLTTFEDILLQSSWSSKLALVVAQVERHLALEYTRAKEATHRFFIKSARRLQESADWLVQRHTLHRHAHRRVL